MTEPATARNLCNSLKNIAQQLEATTRNAQFSQEHHHSTTSSSSSAQSITLAMESIQFVTSEQTITIPLHEEKLKKQEPCWRNISRKNLTEKALLAAIPANAIGLMVQHGNEFSQAQLANLFVS